MAPLSETGFRSIWIPLAVRLRPIDWVRRDGHDTADWLVLSSGSWRSSRSGMFPHTTMPTAICSDCSSSTCTTTACMHFRDYGPGSRPSTASTHHSRWMPHPQYAKSCMPIIRCSAQRGPRRRCRHVLDGFRDMNERPVLRAENARECPGMGRAGKFDMFFSDFAPSPVVKKRQGRSHLLSTLPNSVASFSRAEIASCQAGLPGFRADHRYAQTMRCVTPRRSGSSSSVSFAS